MDRKEIKRLLQKAADEWTPVEKALIDQWYKTIGNNSDVSPFADAQDEQKTRDDLRHRIAQQRVDVQKATHWKIRPWWYQVAAAVLLIGGAVWVYRQNASLSTDKQVIAVTIRDTTLSA